MEADEGILFFEKVLSFRQDKLINRLVSAEDEETRGRIKELAHVVSFHDTFVKELDERMEEAKVEEKEGSLSVEE